MYLFYADASGILNPKFDDKDFLYVYTAIGLYEKKWHGFEKTLRREKARLQKKYNLPECLADCEIKSNWIRIPNERSKHIFLNMLTPEELESLVNLYYSQLEINNIRIFSIIVDKRKLVDYFDRSKLHRKAWELLIELIQNFLREEHPKNQGLIIVDDESKKSNLDLSLKHAYLQDSGTRSGLWLTNIVEMPLFTSSELSNGIQLTDLVCYNIYRVFKEKNPEYPDFNKICRFIWRDRFGNLRGLKVFPDDSELWDVLNKIIKGPKQLTPALK